MQHKCTACARTRAALARRTCPYASTRASSVHFAPTRRAALGRRLGGVCWMMSLAKMNPWCGCAVVLEKPARFLRLAPSTWVGGWAGWRWREGVA